MNILEVVVSAVLGSVGGAAVVLLGFSGFLGRVWTNRLLEIDRLHYGGKLEQLRDELNRKVRELQADLDKMIHVHRAQFEVEFDALKQAWAKISRLRAAVCSLRPMSSVVPQDDTEEQKLVRLQKRLDVLGAAHNEALAAVDDRSPFYPQDIHQGFAELLRISGNEMTEVQIEKPFERGWFDRGKKNRDEFLAQTDKVANLIRVRLESLSIYRSE